MAYLNQIHCPVNTAGKPRIVFVHGLGGEMRETWMSDKKNRATLWPKWLGEDTQCPVWLFSYGAAMSRWSSEAMALPKLATLLLESLAVQPKLEATPLVLMGHSLGGLVIKAALSQGMERDVERHRLVAQNIKGIAFIGTPHFGSRLASLASWLPFFRANPQMRDLALDQANLEELHQRFSNLQRKLKIEVRVCIESRPMRLPGILSRLPIGTTVVSPSSSQPHIVGEAGTHYEDDHRTIAKPTSRSSGIYPSMSAFIRKVETLTAPMLAIPNERLGKTSSDRLEAIFPEQRRDEIVHLAFAIQGHVATGGSDSAVSGAICLTTDSPKRLQTALAQIRTRISDDPLVPVSIKTRVKNASLREIMLMPIAKIAALREISKISFSAYFYYCYKSDYDIMLENDRIDALLVRPLFHRLSKRGNRIATISTSAPEMPALLEKAARQVAEKFHREPMIPKAGSTRYAPLEELAKFIVFAACDYLANRSDCNAMETFANLRTRIRYAENIATGEKHLRDKNPLP